MAARIGICEATTARGTPCRNRGRLVAYDRVYCGVHYKNAKPDKPAPMSGIEKHVVGSCAFEEYLDTMDTYVIAWFGGICGYSIPLLSSLVIAGQCVARHEGIQKALRSVKNRRVVSTKSGNMHSLQALCSKVVMKNKSVFDVNEELFTLSVFLTSVGVCFASISCTLIGACEKLTEKITQQLEFDAEHKSEICEKIREYIKEKANSKPKEPRRIETGLQCFPWVMEAENKRPFQFKDRTGTNITVYIGHHNKFAEKVFDADPGNTRDAEYNM